MSGLEIAASADRNARLSPEASPVPIIALLVDAVIATWSNAMTDDQLKEWASKASSEIVKREGAALALSACDRDEPAIEADSNLLGIAIAQAIIEAYQAGVAAASRR
jgi:hypothetical protein